MRAPFGLVLLLAAPGLCHAQPAPPATEQITVGAPDAAAAAGGTTSLGAADIASSGAATIGALLDQLPAFGSQGVNGAQNDGGFGEYFIDLRNLNFDRTLVLVDGKRFVLSGIQTDEAVDLNTIPASFIDHVEILKDGTQPRTAADAVAGVVNIVLKDRMEGVHVDSYGAAAGAGGDGTAEITVTGGHALADGHVALGADLFSRAPVLQSTRGWSADPIAMFASTPSGTQPLFGSPATPGGHIVAPGIDALALGHGATRPFDASTDGYDDAGSRYLQGGLQRASVYLDGDTALTDSVTADAELLFTDRRATTLLPPQTLGLAGTGKHPDGFVIPASDPFNPTGQAVTLERVVSEAGNMLTTTSGPVWRVLAGLEGVLGDWDWSAGLDHGQSVSRYVTTNAINLTRALQSAGNGGCADDACTQANWFGPGSLSPEAVGFIRDTARSRSAYAETVWQAAIGGPLLRLPAGPVRFRAGGEIRDETGSTTVDAVTASGDQAGPDAAPSGGGTRTYEAFGTLDVPVLRDLPGARRLDVSLAGRATATNRYGAFGTYRAVLAYEPLSGIHLRGVTGTARRPPAISEAFGGITAAPQTVEDPCDAANGLRGNPVVDANCRALGLGPGFRQASPQIEVESGGNPRLRPEQSENEMLGIGLDPPAWPWFGATVDWYHYRIRDAIDSLADTDPNLIPDGCVESPGLRSPWCTLVTRVAGGGNAGQIGSILALDENVGTIKTDGLEFGWKLTAPAFSGSVALNGQTVWLQDYRIRTDGSGGFTQYAGRFPGLSGVGSYARVRSRESVALTEGAWEGSLTGRFISGARVIGASGPGASAPGIFYADAQMQFRFGRAVAMAGIDNLADQRPPLLIDGETNTDTATYDVLGRVFWARVRVDF